MASLSTTDLTLKVQKSDSQQDSSENNNSDQDLDYLIVVDFECNSGTKGFVLNEIIEFPFVLIDINQCKIIKEYTSFVKPTYHKKLTNFIKNLTYIEQSDVDNAPILQEVLKTVESSIEETIQNKPACMIFDCDADAVYLRSEINLKNIEHSNLFKKYINLKEVFEKFYSKKANSLQSMLKLLNIEEKGHSHIGLHDARNIASVVLHLIKDGCVFEKNMNHDVIIPKK